MSVKDGVLFYRVLGEKAIILTHTCFVDTDKKRLMKRFLKCVKEQEREAELKLNYHKHVRRNVETQLYLLEKEEDANKQGYPF